MLDQPRTAERLKSWATRNGIEISGGPAVVGYWCRVSGIDLNDEMMSRNYGEEECCEASCAWQDADEEITSELAAEAEQHQHDRDAENAATANQR